MTSKLQLAIDAESENRSDLATQLKRVPQEDLKAKQKIEAAVQKSEDKMQSMAVLMLHYCSGKSMNVGTTSQSMAVLMMHYCSGKSQRKIIRLVGDLAFTTTRLHQGYDCFLSPTE